MRLQSAQRCFLLPSLLIRVPLFLANTISLSPWLQLGNFLFQAHHMDGYILLICSKLRTEHFCLYFFLLFAPAYTILSFTYRNASPPDLFSCFYCTKMPSCLYASASDISFGFPCQPPTQLSSNYLPLLLPSLLTFTRRGI